MTRKAKKFLLFALVALAWLALDVASKAHFEAYFEPGQVITPPILGLFRFHLIYNTGAAWGMFGDSTFILGVISSLVCITIAVLAFVFRAKLSKGEMIGLALVFAGGLGNVIDRFVFGYVRDFIEFTFIDFPIFNIADVGVTCGIVIFLVCYIIRERKSLFGKQTDDTSSDTESEAL